MAEIYVIENIINGKCYIGQTVKTSKIRFTAHKNNTKSCIGKAIQKYGWDNFKTYTYYVSENMLDFFEIEMIKLANCIAPNGYNKRVGGHFGYRHSEETKKKIGDIHRGRKHTDEYKDACKKRMLGKPSLRKGLTNSKEQTEKHRKAMIGKKASEETKKKMSLKKIGYKYRLTTCIYCGKIGGINTMKRWHFDNCKELN